MLLIRTSSSRPATTTYERQREHALAALARRCPWLGRDDREGAFHDAYAELLEHERDGLLDLDALSAAQLRALLRDRAVRKGLERGGAARRRTRVAGS